MGAGVDDTIGDGVGSGVAVIIGAGVLPPNNPVPAVAGADH